MLNNITYHVVKRKVDGAYLLDKRNETVYSGNSKDDAFEVFNKYIQSKQKCDTYVLFEKVEGVRFLNILREQ